MREGAVPAVDEGHARGVTRAEYLTSVMRTMDPANAESGGDGSGQDAVRRALSAGIIDPGLAEAIGAGAEDAITREEIASVNVSILEHKIHRRIRYGNLDRYVDAERISRWAVDRVKSALALGLVRASQRTLFGPRDAINSSESEAYVKRLLHICSGNEPELLVDMPDVRLLFDVKMRDTSICLAGDGMYYLTGSTGQDIWDHNDGIELWRSPDLHKWEYLGLVWSIERDGTWHKKWNIHHGRPIRSIWAPEIHYIRGNFFLTYSMPLMGTGLLKSSTGKPEGPYVSAVPYDMPFTRDIDASLFEDDDGKVYFLYGGGNIALMNEDMSGLAEEPRRILATPPDLNPAHHGAHKNGKLDDIGSEGVFLFKFDGRYYMSCADWYSTSSRYSSMVAFSDSIYGPYRHRHEAVPCGGHNTYFKDKHGQWWSTFFGNDAYSPFRERPAIVQVEFDTDGKIATVRRINGR